MAGHEARGARNPQIPQRSLPPLSSRLRCSYLPSIAFLLLQRSLCLVFSLRLSLSLFGGNKNYWTWHYLLVSMVIKSVSDNGPSLAVVSFGNFSNTVAQATCISI